MCLGPCGSGISGVIRRIDADGNYDVVVDPQAGAEGFDFYKANEIEPVPPEQQGELEPAVPRRPTVGSRVRATASADDRRCLGSASSGRVGVIDRDDHDSTPWHVVCNGKTGWYKEGQLELVPRLVVGERVAACPGADASKCLGDPALGRIGVLLRDDRDSSPYKVAFAEEESYYREDEVRAV